MTRLELLFKHIDEEADRLGEFFDPIPCVLDYLRERNDFMAAQLPANYAVTMQAAANQFDNADVDETPEQQDIETKFDEAIFSSFGHPLEQVDKMFAGLHGSKEEYE